MVRPKSRVEGRFKETREKIYLNWVQMDPFGPKLEDETEPLYLTSRDPTTAHHHAAADARARETATALYQEARQGRRDSQEDVEGVQVTAGNGRSYQVTQAPVAPVPATFGQQPGSG